MQYVTPPPDPHPRVPRYVAPAGSTDCCIHLYGPKEKYGFDPTNPYISEDALPETYLALQEKLRLSYAVIVSGAAYGRSYSHLLDTLGRFPKRFVGIAMPPDDVSDSELARMAGLGVRGVRYFSAAKWKSLPTICPDVVRRIAGLGWHVQFYPSGPDLVDYEQVLLSLGVDIVLDHFAAIPAEQGVDQPAMKVLLRMLDTGRVWLKLSAPMRCCQEEYPYSIVTPMAQFLTRRVPERLLWGSDWPHPTMVGRKMPNDGDLFDLITDWTENESVRRRILVDNPAEFYGFGRV